MAYTKLIIDSPSTKQDFQKRFCLECKSFTMTFGCADFSEYTPGYPPEIICSKGHYYTDELEDKFDKLIRTACTCEEFELLEEDK